MNKDQFINFITTNRSITKKAAADAIDIFIESVTEAINQKHEVNLVGFGRFYTIAVKARQGVNPKTRAKMMIDAYIQPAFRAGQKLKDAARDVAEKK